MRFTTLRPCGGKAYMAISSEPLDLDLKKARKVMEADGYRIKELEEGMLLVTEKDCMEITLYPQGKVMFLPLNDRSECIRRSTELLERLR